MDDLIARIRAAIDEDERLALAAVKWNYGVQQWADDGEPDWAHIARHDPGRVLAMVAAHLKIVDTHSPMSGQPDVCPVCWRVTSWTGSSARDAYPCPTLLALAKGYGIES